MNFNITICDDDPADVRKISEYLNIFQVRYDIDFTIIEYTDSNKLYRDYTNKTKCDIMLLDVEMPSKSGLDIANHVRNIPDDNVIIIFISSYPEYMQNSFDVQTFQYLSKPLEYNRFETVLKNAIKKLETRFSNTVIVQQSGEKFLIPIDSIIYMDSNKSIQHYINMHCTSETFQVQGTISEWKNKLETLSFISPSRGFLVNINHIRICKDLELVLSDSSTIPVSRRRKQEVKERFSKNIITLRHF